MTDFLTWVQKREKFFPAAVCVLIFVLYLPHVLLSDYILRDVAERYAPMAESFAAGHFQYAFHPRIQTLHPLISGIFASVTGCSGFSAAQLSGLLFLGLCAFPLYYLLKLVFDLKTAVRGTLLLPLISPVVLICISGLRESHKMFALLLLVSGILTVFKFREKYSGYLLTGAGCGLAFCIRNDLVIPALALMTAAGAMEFAFSGSCKRSCAGLAVMFPLFFFETIVNYFISGYAVPGCRFWIFFKEISPAAATPEGFMLYIVLPSLVLYFAAITAGGCLLRRQKGRKVLAVCGILLFAALAVDVVLQSLSVVVTDWQDGMKIFASLIRPVFAGCNLPLFILALAGIYCLKKQNEWNDGQRFLLFLFFFWITSTVFTITAIERKLYVSDRYLLPASILLTGWGVRGIGFCAEQLKKYLNRYIVICLSVLLIIACFCHAYSTVLEERFKREKVIQKQSLKIITQVIRQNYRGPEYFTPEFSLFQYRGYRRPRIACMPLGKQAVSAYRCGGSLVFPNGEPDFIIASAEENFSEKKWRKIAGDLPFGKTYLNVWELKEVK